MTMDTTAIKNILEAALLAAGEPLNEERLSGLFNETERPARGQLREALQQLRDDYAARSLELREVGSGWRIQVIAAPESIDTASPQNRSRMARLRWSLTAATVSTMRNGAA